PTTSELYTLSLHDALPIFAAADRFGIQLKFRIGGDKCVELAVRYLRGIANEREASLLQGKVHVVRQSRLLGRSVGASLNGVVRRDRAVTERDGCRRSGCCRLNDLIRHRTLGEEACRDIARRGELRRAGGVELEVAIAGSSRNGRLDRLFGLGQSRVSGMG